MQIFKIKKQNISFFLVIFYIILACIFFYLVVNPLQDTEKIWIGADTGNYVEYSKLLSENEELLTISSNLLGPIFILRMVNHNYDLILFINCFLFFLSYILVRNNFKIDEQKFILLLLMNPMLFISLVSINKEIFGLFSITLLACFLKNKNILYIILSLITSILVRWQQSVVIILVFFMTDKIYVYRDKKILNLLFMIVIISVIYPSFISPIINQVMDFETLNSQQDKAFGLSILLNELQDRYMFFVAVVPKILISYFGNIIKVFTFPIETLKLLIEPESVNIENIYNTYIIVGHQISMLILLFIFSKNIIQNRVKFNNISDNIFLCGVYSILYSLGLAIQYRYFFPIYILFCLEISQKKHLITK
ncbi:hypothetical protein BMF77_01252 [Dolichospermum sp. UHCC 0315A]|uniref:hypothetical protein n=1 Tax=Dolichospermum sp. UHCC 0315A TaxID=1914871 RepID=UPI0011E66723|nr:hypothetical protein [Dolichospermum sp. UHCC 0315A]QEI40680.1 hypothetical protein BMF77_01252 [Dolichospermum sp. UHCC 0315A]